MQIRTRVKDGATCVEVVDPSDGAIIRSEAVCEGEQFVVTATSADSPADLTFSDVEAIPEPEAEAAETGEAGESSEAGEVEQPSGSAEGAEDAAGAGGESPQGEAAEAGTPAEGNDGEQGEQDAA